MSTPTGATLRAAVRRLPLAALLLAAAAQAQYKIVGPDGRITYTDRPPPAAQGERVVPLSRIGEEPSGSAALPLELRQVAARYPVTLYTAADCAPCDTGRQLLRERGIPYAERTASTAEDSLALERLSGGREVPVLTIGGQVLRGLQTDSWNSYLDAAGYPRESKLPAGYRQPPATALVPPPTAPARSQPIVVLPSGPEMRPTPQTSPEGIRF